MVFFSFLLLKGDSGGLLTCGNKKMLDGIVSFGYACGSATFPGNFFRYQNHDNEINLVFLFFLFL